MRKSKVSKTIAKAKANIKAHSNSKVKSKAKLITGNEHYIHESNEANFAINVYEPMTPEPYI